MVPWFAATNEPATTNSNGEKKMFRENTLVTSKPNLKPEEEKEQAILPKKKKKKNPQLVFLEILCPQTKKKIVSSNCQKCQHKKVLYRQHPAGKTLETIICNFSNGTE